MNAVSGERGRTEGYLDPLVLCDDILNGSYLSSLLANTLKSNQVEINTDAKSQRPIARLKEPRDLFTLPKEPECAQEAARWPSECQVVDMKVQHIDAMPAFPEAYYTATGKEIVVKVIGEESGQVVYQYNPMSAVNYFTRSVSGGNRIPPVFTPSSDLKFESRFESGNLAKAVKITDTYYELSIRSDLYTNKHMQWFYFMVENTKKSLVYRFSIVNLLKGDSLYNEGMRPVMYSCKDAVIRKIGWRRCGSNINYYQNDNNGDEDSNVTYTLTFNVEFPYDDDCVFLAHTYPYTYTDLQEYLIKLQNHPVKSQYSKLRLLCKTLAGNNVYYLTVTDSADDVSDPRFISGKQDDTQETKPKKRAVVMTARVHPGESPASWMMKGVIDFITGDSPQARELRERFIFKLIPMLNPDGVIVGNNRCSLSGRDLNRQYRTVIRETYPPVWHTKVLIKRLIEDCGVAMYCDLHAHSRKHNVFIYGCENKRVAEKRLQEQVFPLMLHKNTADKFSFENCKFRINKDKEGTGRVVIWMMGVDNSYTLEASFAGSTLGSRHHTHFTTVDYENMGRSFCETLLDYVDDTPAKGLKIREVSEYGLISDEGELSDNLSDDEENKKREDRTLTAPPPSPVLSTEKKSSKLNKSPKLKHQPHIVVHSPSFQRKTIQMATAKLDLDAQLDGYSSSDEPLASGAAPVSQTSGNAFKINGNSPKKSFPERPKGIHMPPELIVTSTHPGDQSVFDRLYRGSDPTRSYLNVPSKPVSRRESQQRKSPDVRPKSRQVKEKGETSDSEAVTTMRKSSEVKTPIKKFWRVLSSDNIPWSYSKYDEHEEILKACSQKLAELKKKHKMKLKERLEVDMLGPPQGKVSASNKKKLKKKTRSQKIERAFTFTETGGSGNSFRVKSIKPSELKVCEDEKASRNSTKKGHKQFRKGGIISLATIKSHYFADNNETGTESLETTSNKKKKKRKFLQMTKSVKSAVSAVTAVSIVKKDDSNNKKKL